MIIRKATLKDCEIVQELSGTKELRTSHGEAPALWWIEAFVKEKQIFFIAEENEEIIGFIFGERTTGNICIMHEIFVRKEYRDKGLGTKLMREAEKECKRRKIFGILLYGYNHKSVSKLLKKQGYKKGNAYNEYFKII